MPLKPNVASKQSSAILQAAFTSTISELPKYTSSKSPEYLVSSLAERLPPSKNERESYTKLPRSLVNTYLMFAAAGTAKRLPAHRMLAQRAMRSRRRFLSIGFFQDIGGEMTAT